MYLSHMSESPKSANGMNSFVVRNVGNVVWGQDEERDSSGKVRTRCILGTTLLPLCKNAALTAANSFPYAGDRIQLEEHMVRHIFDEMDVVGNAVLTAEEVVKVLVTCGLEQAAAEASTSRLFQDAGNAHHVVAV
jgi:hypothetical protein